MLWVFFRRTVTHLKPGNCFSHLLNWIVFITCISEVFLGNFLLQPLFIFILRFLFKAGSQKGRENCKKMLHFSPHV